MNRFRKVAFGFFALAIATGLVSPRSVFATLMVSYSTSGTFDVNSVSGGPTIRLSSGNLTVDVTYTGTTQSNVVIPNATAPFGVFTITAVNDGNANLNTAGTFSLLLTQTNPSASSGSFTSVVSGSIQLGKKDVTITFNSPPNPITLGSITYLLPNSILVTSPPRVTGAHQDTPLTANISGTSTSVVATPEPATLVSSAIGAMMFLGYSRRRKATFKA